MPEKKIIINPNNITSLSEGESIEFICGVYIEGEKIDDLVKCKVNNVNPYSYILSETIDGYKLLAREQSEEALVLIFSADGCDDIVMEIELIGLI